MTMRICSVVGCLEWGTHRMVAFDTAGHAKLSWPVCERCSDKAASAMLAHHDIGRVSVRKEV